MTRAIRDCRNCGGAGCRECGNEGIEDVACFTPPASFTVRSDEVGFEDDRENCPCYEGVKINDGVDQCLHPDNRTAGNWCALDTCPLLRACIKYQPAPRPKQREVARIGDMHQAAALPAVPDGVALIAAERHRQVTAEGLTPEHDDEHTDGAMAQAGGCYALAYALEAQGHGKDSVPTPWPWDATWWKPSPADPVRQLVKAGALIAAEIDRLRRAATPAHDQPEGDDEPDEPCPECFSAGCNGECMGD